MSYAVSLQSMLQPANTYFLPPARREGTSIPDLLLTAGPKRFLSKMARLDNSHVLI